MKYDILLKSGIALLPQRPSLDRQRLIESEVDIAIHNGRIEKIAPLIKDPASETISCKGLHIFPGLIDTQVHFREPGMTHKEDIEHGSRGALLGGITAFFEMPNTIPPTTTRELFLQKVKIAEVNSHVNFAFYLGANGQNINEIRLADQLPHCCGIKVFMGSSTGSLLVENDETILEILENSRLPVAVHCEDEARLRERRGIAESTANVLAHPLWRDPESAAKATRRLVALAEKANVKVHVLHISSRQEIEFLRDKKQFASLEVLPNHLSFSAPQCYEKLGNLIQQNPPVREEVHTSALWEGVQNGLIDIIGSDHAPHSLEEKSKNYPLSPSGTPGVQTMVPVLLNHVNKGKLTLSRCVEMLSENPRERFQIQNKCRLQEGFDGDLSIFDLQEERKVENSWLACKSQWSPFSGDKLRGWPKMVFLNGKLAMAEDKIILPKQGKGLNFARSSKN